MWNGVNYLLKMATDCDFVGAHHSLTLGSSREPRRNPLLTVAGLDGCSAAKTDACPRPLPAAAWGSPAPKGGSVDGGWGGASVAPPPLLIGSSAKQVRRSPSRNRKRSNRESGGASRQASAYGTTVVNDTSVLPPPLPRATSSQGVRRLSTVDPSRLSKAEAVILAEEHAHGRYAWDSAGRLLPELMLQSMTNTGSSAPVARSPSADDAVTLPALTNSPLSSLALALGPAGAQEDEEGVAEAPFISALVVDAQSNPGSDGDTESELGAVPFPPSSSSLPPRLGPGPDTQTQAEVGASAGDHLQPHTRGLGEVKESSVLATTEKSDVAAQDVNTTRGNVDMHHLPMAWEEREESGLFPLPFFRCCTGLYICSERFAILTMCLPFDFAASQLEAVPRWTRIPVEPTEGDILVVELRQVKQSLDEDVRQHTTGMVSSSSI